MTTPSTKTPMFFRFAPLRRHPPPISGPLSSGLHRSNARLLVGVSPKLTFTQRTRTRSRCGRDSPKSWTVSMASTRTGRGSFRPEHSTWSRAREQSEAFDCARSPSAVPSLYLCNWGATSSEGRKVLSGREAQLCDCILTAVGILARHRVLRLSSRSVVENSEGAREIEALKRAIDRGWTGRERRSGSGWWRNRLARGAGDGGCSSQNERTAPHAGPCTLETSPEVRQRSISHHVLADGVLVPRDAAAR
jgi:hypothetical protein